MDKIINTVNNLIWSNALIILCLAVGIYFSFATHFFYRFVTLERCCDYFLMAKARIKE